MTSRGLVAWALAFSLGIAPAVATAQAGGQGSDATTSGPWLERSAYEIPFARRAEWLDFMAGGGSPGDTAALAAAFPEVEFDGLLDGSLAFVERVAFRSDSLVLRGILVRPPGEGPFPAVVYARGGNREYGRLRFLDVMRMFAIAQAGRTVLAPEYRGEGGSEGEPTLSAGDIDDVLAAVDALRAWPDADVSSLSLVGLSRGGGVTAWALTRSPDFDAVVLIAPSLDLEDNARRRPALDSAVYALSLDGYDESRSEALRRGSAIRAVDAVHSAPVLVLHGAEDTAVHPSVSLDFSRRLLERGHPHRLIILEGGSHSLIEHAREVRLAITDWLEAHAPKPPTRVP